MARIAVLSYIRRKSPVHELTGTTKLIFFIAWSCGQHGHLRHESAGLYAAAQRCDF